MYTHKMNKKEFAELEKHYNYEMKQKRDRHGYFVSDLDGLSLGEIKKTIEYNKEMAQVLKDHVKKYSQFDLSEEASADLRQRRKEVFDKYFEVSGDFMKTIKLK